MFFSASCSAPAVMTPIAPAIPTTSPTNKMMGAAVEALRRTPSPTFACTSSLSLLRGNSSRENTRTSRFTSGTTVGDSALSAMTATNAIPMDMFIAPVPPIEVATTIMATAPADAIRPIAQRPTRHHLLAADVVQPLEGTYASPPGE